MPFGCNRSAIPPTASSVSARFGAYGRRTTVLELAILIVILASKIGVPDP
jgi:hypothetical protein